jgi:hypothetical protein
MRVEYWVNIKHVDNRLVVYLDGETIWDSGIISGDPELNECINITGILNSHSDITNELIFEGFNDTYSQDQDGLNPWHFHYSVVRKSFDDAGILIAEKEMMPVYNEKHLSNPNVRAINNRYKLVKKGDTFKVVSNSLQQQFYN